MTDRGSSGLFPLVLFALILVISAVAVVLGADDANSAATVPAVASAPGGVSAP
jgi:hypothetical protein